MVDERDELDDLEKYENEHESDDDEFDDLSFEDQMFCTGMVNDAEEFNLKVKSFKSNEQCGDGGQVAIDAEINAWLNEKNGRNITISRSIKLVEPPYNGWQRVWYYEAT